MRILADTHALLWWWKTPQQLSAVAKRAMESDSNMILISAAVAWEIAIKTKTGRINFDAVLARWDDLLAEDNFTELPIVSEHGIRAGQLPLHHRDPFDRLLAAQAQSQDLPILSADRIFDAYGVRRIW
ncbi:MAG: type II toxin-antitoxin system VapC family toxin [Candidatus Korobacteraceae bacterium]